MGIQPFIYGHSGAFSTHEKNEIGIFLQLFPMFNMYAARVFSRYRMPIHKTYEAATFDLPKMLLPSHTFLLLSPKKPSLQTR
ncbi:unknown [Prevotella sp. CAG:891]|nr:unknown [Prevotella sp. CAG:891]